MTDMEKLRDISTALSHGLGTYPGMVLALCDEVERLRKGEFICQKCGLRKNDEHPKADF